MTMMSDQTEKRMRAVALRSARKNDAIGADAPMVVAKGYGVTADAIIQNAREHGLYVHESSDLVNLLMHVDLDQQIPPQMYVVVAEFLAWLYTIEGNCSASSAIQSADHG